MRQQMQMCQPDHLTQHRGLTQTSKCRNQPAYHCISCVSLLYPNADSVLAGLASEEICTGGEQGTVPSIHAPHHLPPPSTPAARSSSPAGAAGKPMASSLHPWRHPWMGMSHPRGISRRKWRNYISADEQIKTHLCSLKVKTQNALAAGQDHL